MGNLDRRLEALEGRGDNCVVCGWGPRATLHIEWAHDDHDEPDEEEPEYCPACGRPDRLVITWPDVDD